MEREITGPIGTRVRREKAHDVARGKQPPAWWHGDEEASRSSMAAIFAMKRGR